METVIAIKRPVFNYDTDIALVLKHWGGRDKIYQIDGVKYKIVINDKNQVEGLEQIAWQNESKNSA